jgi:hypothetical protein
MAKLIQRWENPKSEKVEEKAVEKVEEKAPEKKK